MLLEYDTDIIYIFFVYDVRSEASKNNNGTRDDTWCTNIADANRWPNDIVRYPVHVTNPFRRRRQDRLSRACKLNIIARRADSLLCAIIFWRFYEKIINYHKRVAHRAFRPPQNARYFETESSYIILFYYFFSSFYCARVGLWLLIQQSVK